MNYEAFENIYERAVTRFTNEETLKEHLFTPLDKNALESISDDRWLSAFSQKVFQSGISWKVVRDKWPNFETVFFNFDIEKMLLIHNEMWEEKAKDTRIIRHLGKVMTIRDNAAMIHEIAKEHGSFSNFVSEWPSSNIVELWQQLKKQGNRLGGNTGPYTLRSMGKDSFLLTKDVEGYLRSNGIIETGRETKSALAAAQSAFNHWHDESGLPYSHISQCIAFGVN
ncbi:DNA-3-methyladenine glycosylase I [Marinomonas mediterranea]|jgi:3-methyladenine DNA glycosylase|uniref:Methyladenine glycosylase n=1 Tax=Marinomonas mediterranea (strain ATCC 700492 / JCM 21426 / NBRC 103028 / MMB-1) TaxID=717774 RepID=F2JY24_MARM1|nr:DNA-3-methyladenine glycosylase I [Marinomonas mediterranea]ADZ90760.1 methyladenine glycosylase [Marinomonas mediterranea MMB-1]WCN08801.1 DNA-3-methyladenine glycosylase I [Marinomonas mediterranea]WCN12847.1 DNA-3-methyladenine glycosylase I [Marinomonas mediterranea]WCN16915.1 DNA-3-methyladenine glycosylase I [Marinomonas mediterranea MMB-1]